VLIRSIKELGTTVRAYMDTHAELASES